MSSDSSVWPAFVISVDYAVSCYSVRNEWINKVLYRQVGISDGVYVTPIYVEWPTMLERMFIVKHIAMALHRGTCATLLMFNGTKSGTPSSKDITHWGLNKMAVILQAMFSKAFPWIQRFVFWAQLPWPPFLWVQLKTSHHCVGPGNGWLPKRWEVITWANHD